MIPFAFALVAAMAPFSYAAQAAQIAGLRIVVVEGEDAVNIVQQRTAVAPVVEVRDRNDQPVAGAVVRFAIRSGRATFGGPRTLMVTTNAAGRAAVATLTSTGTGAIQISATAAFQGQRAAITIAQTNVMTAAASGAGASGGAGAGAGGAGGGAGGGGISATTIGVVGGAVAGGTLVAEKVRQTGAADYSGNVTGDVFFVFPSGGGCTRTHHYTGTMTMHLQVDGDRVTGTVHTDGSQVVTAVTCTGGPQLGNTSTWGFVETTVQGTTGALTFIVTESNRFPAEPPNPAGTVTNKYDFSGSISGSAISGTLTLASTIANDGFGVTGTAAGSMPVSPR